LRAAPDAARHVYQGRLLVGLAFAAVSLLALAWWATRPTAGSGWLAVLVLVQSVAAAPFSLHLGSAAARRERPPRLEAPYPGPRIVTPIQTNAETGEGGWDAIDRTHAIAYRTGRSSSNVAAGVENAEAYTGFGSVRSAVLEGAGPLRWKALRRLGVSHVVAAPLADDEDRRELERTLGPDATPVASGAGGVQAWAVPRREWVTVAPAVRALPDTREAARALGSALQRGSAEVILEAPEAPPAGPGTVISARRSLEVVEVVADCASPCVVVVNDAFAPGWVAEIDGAPAPVLPADVLVRAVPWPAGRHRMVMRYEPPEVRLGVAVSALAAAVMLVAVLIQARRARARPGGR
ncbi:MAG TPA: hypothetical protein VFM53_08775, partial [Anaeromyxobacteraceae bacterium]|nr:hypothetical protein [Anaeromyxobacteraceae bacterium]